MGYNFIGAQGPTGPAGATGPTGPAGFAEYVTDVIDGDTDIVTIDFDDGPNHYVLVNTAAPVDVSFANLESGTSGFLVFEMGDPAVAVNFPASVQWSDYLGIATQNLLVAQTIERTSVLAYTIHKPPIVPDPVVSLFGRVVVAG